MIVDHVNYYNYFIQFQGVLNYKSNSLTECCTCEPICKYLFHMAIHMHSYVDGSECWHTL